MTIQTPITAKSEILSCARCLHKNGNHCNKFKTNCNSARDSFLLCSTSANSHTASAVGVLAVKAESKAFQLLFSILKGVTNARNP